MTQTRTVMMVASKWVRIWPMVMKAKTILITSTTTMETKNWLISRRPMTPKICKWSELSPRSSSVSPVPTQSPTTKMVSRWCVTQRLTIVQTRAARILMMTWSERWRSQQAPTLTILKESSLLPHLRLHLHQNCCIRRAWSRAPLTSKRSRTWFYSRKSTWSPTGLTIKMTHPLRVTSSNRGCNRSNRYYKSQATTKCSIWNSLRQSKRQLRPESRKRLVLSKDQTIEVRVWGLPANTRLWRILQRLRAI